MTKVIEAPTGVKPINHWIGGKRRAGASGRTGPVYNPATGAQTGAVDFASAEEVDAAVQAAAAAFPAWRELSLSRRAELFFRIRQLFDDHRGELARLLTAEHGKVLSDAMGEVARGIEVIPNARMKNVPTGAVMFTSMRRSSALSWNGVTATPPTPSV